ncbi:MAG: oxygen-independent coproporphyrinogen III oxidase [Lentisphaerales bacterium]|nr:oxygen-independent coproporphyrinogen III oxidase [Lentisphaerales bacterium]
MTNSKISLKLLNKYNVTVPRYTSYPTAPEWRDNLTQESYAQKVKTLKVQNGIALYIHIPFCEKLCWYCGCNTIIKKLKSHSEKYVKYLIKEIEQVSQILGEKIKVKQLHWGGGSPNFLTDKQTIALLDKIDECFDVDYDGEIAIEVDPRTTQTSQIYLYKKLGFNRISMGIQSFDPKVQKAINRIQPFEMIEDLVALCRFIGFKSINFDLIYGLPKQSLSSFIATLNKTKVLSPDRIALYSFAHLPNIINHHTLIKAEDLPSTDLKFNLFLEARAYFKENGYTDIAMDHFAKENDELAIAYKNKELHRNFMGYTVQKPRDSLGFGLSSISYIDHTFMQNQSKRQMNLTF